MNIPLIDLEGQYRDIKEEIDAAIQDVLNSTRFIMGEQVSRLEAEVADYCDTDYALGVASGTDALLLSLKALGIGPGDEVIVPTFTFFATAGVVSRLGATPVFADIDPVSYNITPDEILKRITPRTKAIIPVHLYGQPAQMDKIMEIARENDLKVVEDACQAIGAEYRGTKVSNFGETTALSFFPSKNLGAYGDGGMVLTNDRDLYEMIKKLRVHGASTKYFHDEVGYNSRLDALQAAILRVKLNYLDQWNQGRQRVASTYDRLIRVYDLQDSITLPVKKVEDSQHVYHQYVIRVNNRDEVQEHLQEKGISTAIYYPLPLHLQPCYRDLNYSRGDMPVAEQYSKEVLALPIDPGLDEEQIKQIVLHLCKSVE